MSIESTEILEEFLNVKDQIKGFYDEISLLAKKSPNDAINPFKLKFINAALNSCNKIIKAYKPLNDFNEFDADDVPSNSDIVFILGQYLKAIERFRSDNIIYSDFNWFYKVNGKLSSKKAEKPTNA